jgi:hypothetical protein
MSARRVQCPSDGKWTAKLTVHCSQGERRAPHRGGGRRNLGQGPAKQSLSSSAKHSLPSRRKCCRKPANQMPQPSENSSSSPGLKRSGRRRVVTVHRLRGGKPVRDLIAGAREKLCNVIRFTYRRSSREYLMQLRPRLRPGHARYGGRHAKSKFLEPERVADRARSART